MGFEDLVEAVVTGPPAERDQVPVGFSTQPLVAAVVEVSRREVPAGTTDCAHGRPAGPSRPGSEPRLAPLLPLGAGHPRLVASPASQPTCRPSESRPRVTHYRSRHLHPAQGPHAQATAQAVTASCQPVRLRRVVARLFPTLAGPEKCCPVGAGRPGLQVHQDRRRRAQEQQSGPELHPAQL